MSAYRPKQTLVPLGPDFRLRLFEDVCQLGERPLRNVVLIGVSHSLAKHPEAKGSEVVRHVISISRANTQARLAFR